MSEKPKKRPNSKPSWSDIKIRLADFDRAGLIQLVSDLYASSKDNKTFLHARFAFGADALNDYKKRIQIALAPDISRRFIKPSVATAKKSVSEYTKAIGEPFGIRELRVFWCETAIQFSIDYGYDDVSYYEAMIRQCFDACRLLLTIPEPELTQYIERLETVRDDAAQVGYGVSYELNDILEDMLENLPEPTEVARVPIVGEEEF